MFRVYIGHGGFALGSAVVGFPLVGVPRFLLKPRSFKQGPLVVPRLLSVRMVITREWRNASRLQ